MRSWDEKLVEVVLSKKLMLALQHFRGTEWPSYKLLIIAGNRIADIHQNPVPFDCHQLEAIAAQTKDEHWDETY